MKKDFNILHGRYGAAKCKKKQPRYTKKEVLDWENPAKRDKYIQGQKQRCELKGLTRAGRLAYFKKTQRKME